MTYQAYDGPRRSGGRRIYHGARYVWPPGSYFYSYDADDQDDCYTQRLRAEASGSDYWWRRYRQCRSD